ncbi:MAG: hypothetical protein LBU36_01825 [Clostridiales bacterium]|jgi:hypothetical protein|nr:hypothetical protein [Clostridiales bacterium]
MIKTFDKRGNITKQAQKARFPKFIVCIDGRADAGFAIYEKAMTETGLAAAMKTLEHGINQRREDIYLCEIYENTGETNAIGEPLYEMIIRARMGEYGLNG